MLKRFCFALMGLAVLWPVNTQAESLIETRAKQALVLDYNTGTVLLEKNANEQMPTSSMSKVMTMYGVFDALKKGQVALDDTFLVSEKAWRKGGSKMFVEVDKRVKVEDLIRGVIIQSGNDATIVLAEGVAGSEEAFALSLNEKAKTLGMNASNFTNASGWPDPDHYSTARDLTKLAVALIENFPEYYSYYAETEFTYSNIKQSNRNPLLYRNIGADGIKTGHTDAAGYGLIGAGVHEGRRVVFTMNGLESERARAEEAARLLDFGLKRFEEIALFDEGESVAEIAVANGNEKMVAAGLPESFNIVVPKIARTEFKVSVKAMQPVIAPVKKGDQLGTLIIEVPHLETISQPVFALSDVNETNFFGKAMTKIQTLF